MLRFIVVIVIGTILGLHPKKVPIKELAWMGVSNLFIVLGLIGFGVIIGLDPLGVVKLEEASIIVSALTIFYAIQIAVVIKLIKLAVWNKDVGA